MPKIHGRIIQNENLKIEFIFDEAYIRDDGKKIKSVEYDDIQKAAEELGENGIRKAIDGRWSTAYLEYEQH